jgi:hypothetical protein
LKYVHEEERIPLTLRVALAHAFCRSLPAMAD